MKITALILLIVLIGSIFTAFAYLRVSLYFIDFKLEKHPILSKKIETILRKICIDEGIHVYDKKYNEINVDIVDEKEKAVGMYVYTTNVEYQQRLNNSLTEIESMEREYNLPYDSICRLVGHNSTVTKEDFTLPKILLAETNLKKFGISNYYGTFFHELGHHFAHKEMGKHTEDDADRYAGVLVRQYLPNYALLIHDFSYRYARDKYALTSKEKIIAFIGYLKYVIIEEKKWL